MAAIFEEGVFLNSLAHQGFVPIIEYVGFNLKKMKIRKH